MRARYGIFGAALTVALLACGSSDAGDAAVVPGTTAATARPGNATAEEVAREQRGGLSCPGTPGSRAAGEPVDDIIGVRPGMRLAAAAQVVLCSHPLLVAQLDSSNRFSLQTHGVRLVQGFSATIAKPRIQRTSKEIMAELQQSAMDRGMNRVRRDVAPGEVAWTLGVMGMPGEEVVTDVAREEWYAAGKEPAVSDVEAALIAKYGTPTAVQRNAEQQFLRWAYTPDGRRVQDEPERISCSTNPHRSASVSYSESCGVVIEVVVQGMPDNPALAQHTQLRTVHQAAAVASITATQEKLQQQELARRNAQLNDAKKRGVSPTF